MSRWVLSTGWRSRWTELGCRVRKRIRVRILENGDRVKDEDIELSCPDALPEPAVEDHSW